MTAVRDLLVGVFTLRAFLGDVTEREREDLDGFFWGDLRVAGELEGTLGD